MQIYRRLVIAIIFFITKTFIFSQTISGIQMPSIPNRPASPEMPTISTPSLESRFYVPKNIGAIKKTTTPTANITVPTTPQIAVAPVASKTTPTNTKKTNIFQDPTEFLSAADISSLGSSGLFTSLYGLSDLSSQETLLDSSSASKMLKSIMTQLTEIKKQQDELTEKTKNIEKNVRTTETTENAENTKSILPKILRFVINGYDILDSCKTIYFSNQENDGSFLLTADRRYLSENKSRNETFYLLFKADGNCGSSKGYFVEPAIVQNFQDKKSLVYQLSQKKNLKANKTGNLVTMRSLSPDLKIDLLLDIGE